tara:strand:- start:32 stop:1036 length:1005 start_codon:yes stop_codon:yes gene_type:complete
MIKKVYEINNKIINNYKFYLFHGVNEGYKKEKINDLLSNTNKEDIYNYDEKEILKDANIFFEKLSSKSFFEDQKYIVISQSTNKIYDIVEEILSKSIDDIVIIINTEILDKRSKLRNLFEKEKKLVSVAFYEDTLDTLSTLADNFFKINQIKISKSNINFLVNRCNGDRRNLNNELTKIKYYTIKKKIIGEEELIKLTNIAENHSIYELIDNCLAKNKMKTLRILRENNFSSEDCILITRVLLNKAKKILQLSETFEKNKNLELTINSFKPPIFWKEKEITKQQILNWPPENIKKLIYKLGELEVLIKKNINNSINLVTDFILFEPLKKTNNLV